MEDVKAVERKLEAFDAERLLIVQDKRDLRSKILKIIEPADLLRTNLQKFVRIGNF